MKGYPWGFIAAIIHLHMKKISFFKKALFSSLDLQTSADNLSGCVIPYFKVLSNSYRMMHCLKRCELK